MQGVAGPRPSCALFLLRVFNLSESPFLFFFLDFVFLDFVFRVRGSEKRKEGLLQSVPVYVPSH